MPDFMKTGSALFSALCGFFSRQRKSRRYKN